MATQQITELPDINEFYLNSALYTTYDIKEKDKLFKLIFNTNTLDCFCNDCSANSVFKPDDNKPQKGIGHGMTYPITNPDEWNIELSTTLSNFQKKYTCSRNEDHELMFFLQIKNGKFSKIGQSPALADIAEQEIKKYKKILGDTHYHEFSKAIGLFTHGVGVGSFVYLRRIIENFIIKPSYETAKIRAEWDDAAYQKARVKEKINLLKNELPPFLVDNAVIYSIISKGIHDLTENECREYFPILRSCLEFVLTELETKRLTDQKRKEMQATLAKIAGEIA